MFRPNFEAPQPFPDNEHEELGKTAEQLTPAQYKEIVRKHAQMEAENRADGVEELTDDQRKELRELLTSFGIEVNEDPELDIDMRKAA